MKARKFLAAERCDRCGAPALRQAYKDDVGELLFCNHHYVQHMEALAVTGWEIISDESLIVEKTSVVALTE